LIYACGEIVLVVIGILIALQVNNWNQKRIEMERIQAYARSLIQDLQSDIEMLGESQFQAEKKYHSIARLRTYVQETPIEALSNTDLWLQVYDIMYRPYIWSRSTLNELKSSGGMRYIANADLEKKLVAYEAFSYHLDEDFAYDRSNAENANAVMMQVLNLNSPYFSKIQEMESDRFNDPTLDIYATSIYTDSKAADLPLVSYDPALINQFVNVFINIQAEYRIRGLNEMPRIIENAKELIELLKAEYGE